MPGPLSTKSLASRSALAVLCVLAFAPAAMARRVPPGCPAPGRTPGKPPLPTLDPRLLANLALWSQATQQFVPLGSHEPVPPSARAVVLHFFSRDCVPCVREFPVLRRFLALAGRERPKGALQALYLAEDMTAAQMAKFLVENQSGLGLAPNEVFYRDVGEEIERRLVGRRTWPVTLVLDRCLSVRHTMIGSIDGRADEFLSELGSVLDASPS